MKTNKTFMARPHLLEPNWHVIDATSQTLGRLAVHIARILQGKHQPFYTPNVLSGDYVVVINATKIHVTGNKLRRKLYYHHTGYPGRLKATPLRDMLEKRPSRVIQLAVKGMLPRTTLGSAMLHRLKIYDGTEHPHTAQTGPHITKEG